MQIAPQNKKKIGIYIAIIVISLGVSGWLVYGTLDLGIDESFISQHGSPSDPGSPGTESAIFPYGISLDFSLFSDEKFLQLVEQPGLNITREELGKINAFIP